MVRANRWTPAVAALLAGLAQAASIGAPWYGQPLWWLQLASLGVLAILLLRTSSVRAAVALGWVFGLAWLAGTFWWLFISMHSYGGLPAPFAAGAVLLLAGFLGSYYAFACGLFAKLRHHGGFIDALLFAALWLAAELMRVTWFTGFPWGEGGYAHVDGPLAVLAPYVGVHGIGFVAAVLAYGLAAPFAARPGGAARPWIGPAGALLLLAACAWLPLPSVGSAQPGPRLSVALLQGNIPQDEKFQGGSGIPQALGWYGRQLLDAQAALVVAPETAIPLLPQQLPEGYLQTLRERFARGDSATLIGIPLGNAGEGYSNSVIGLKPDASPYRYDKHHLVPFGEFIPPLFRWFTEAMHIPLGDFNRGAVGQASFVWQGQRLAPNVCYEDLFGEELGARFADAAEAPTMFVNLSNIGWFGNTVAIDQHLNISRMRSLEFDRAMIRATNTGATVVINRRGRVTHSLPRHTRGVLLGEAEGASSLTFYAWWVSRLGLWPLWLLALALPVICVLRSRRTGPTGLA
ncbi:apolipoprotein N-acyltransferase [Ramlibacter sp.]|uniref:apolipoprotein N-acyltransferase n=1 Tax=Ramlibacter sp. TaxID=1917967 RepID=UPI0017AE29BA|nr:apolipoprotein N-acyltransferase [Ramlibacter sp.]MBA2673162.1 apolipoprotein N-acyltransferase [Ramlibacter sp.]